MTTKETVKAIRRASRKIHRYNSNSAGTHTTKKGGRGYDRKKIKKEDRMVLQAIKEREL